MNATTISLEDRLPTFAELSGFDAGAAWDRLTPAQQRAIGILAVRFGTVGQCHGFFHETLADVRAGFESAHWSPEAQATAIWPSEHIDVVERAADAAFSELCDHFDPLWPTLFGWETPVAPANPISSTFRENDILAMVALFSGGAISISGSPA